MKNLSSIHVGRYGGELIYRVSAGVLWAKGHVPLFHLGDIFGADRAQFRFWAGYDIRHEGEKFITVNTPVTVSQHFHHRVQKVSINFI